MQDGAKKEMVSKPPPIDGWLTLLSLGLFITPFLIIYEIFTGDLKTIGITIDLIQLAYVIFLLWLLMKRDYRFPKYLIIYFASLSFLFLVFAFATNWNDNSINGETGKTLVAAAIWIPYVLKSKRVRNTFIMNRNGEFESGEPLRDQRFCMHCGDSIDNDSKFCIHCGKNIGPIS